MTSLNATAKILMSHAHHHKQRPILLPGEFVAEYEIVKLVGQGGYGDIYAVKSPTHAGKIFAMKLESVAAEKQGLMAEYSFLANLQNSDNFPHVLEYGTTTNFRFIVMEMLGPSLSNTRRQLSGRHYTLATTLRLGTFMLKCIQDFHDHGFVHRDIKPGNFLLRNDTRNPLTLIDFGLSRVFINPETNNPFPEREMCGFRGTSKYSSADAQNYHDQSKKDDLISFVYSLVEMVDGALPWGSYKDSTRILKAKIGISQKTLFRSFPIEFRQIWRHVNGLRYYTQPNYDFILSILLKCLEKANVKPDQPYDWEKLSPQQIAEYSPIPELPRAADTCPDYSQIHVMENEDFIDLTSSKCSLCNVF